MKYAVMMMMMLLCIKGIAQNLKENRIRTK